MSQYAVFKYIANFKVIIDFVLSNIQFLSVLYFALLSLKLRITVSLCTEQCSRADLIL